MDICKLFITKTYHYPMLWVFSVNRIQNLKATLPAWLSLCHHHILLNSPPAIIVWAMMIFLGKDSEWIISLGKPLLKSTLVFFTEPVAAAVNKYQLYFLLWGTVEFCLVSVFLFSLLQTQCWKVCRAHMHTSRWFLFQMKHAAWVLFETSGSSQCSNIKRLSVPMWTNQLKLVVHAHHM